MANSRNVLRPQRFRSEEGPSNAKKNLQQPPLPQVNICEKITKNTAISTRFAINRDSAIDPCMDFYRYACGNYQSSRFPKANRATDEADHNNREAVEEQLKRLSNNDLPSGVRFAKVYYDSCQHNVQQPTNPNITWLEKNVGQWPISSDSWNLSQAKISIWSLIGRIRRDFGLNTLLNMDAAIDYDQSDLNNKRHVLQFGYAVRPSKGYWLYDSYATSIKNVVETYLKKQRYFISEISVAEDVDKLIDFEMELQEIEIKSKKNGDSTVVDYSTLKKNYGAINWDDLMLELFGNAKNIPNRFEIFNKRYMQLLNDLVQETAQTNPKTLYNFVIWSWSRNTPDFTENRLGSSLNCFAKVERDMPIAINWIFWHKILNETNLQPLEDIIETVTKTYIEYFENNTELDEKSRAAAIKKFNATVTTIGNRQWRNNRTALEQFYAGLQLPPGVDEFNIQLALHRWKWARVVYILTNPVGRDFETMPESFIFPNAGHWTNQNRQYVNLGKLQPPFYYQNDAPLAVQYGSIGFSIAHEFGHAIDTGGIQRGPKGEPKFLLSKTDQTRFNESQECLKEQYASSCYCTRDYQKHCIDTFDMINDILADQIGIKIAFLAFKNQQQNLQNDQILKNFEPFTADQLFFMSFANTMCIDKDAEAREVDFSSTHPPVPFRINIPLQNSKEFASAFQCDAGKKMNPPEEKRCKIW